MSTLATVALRNSRPSLRTVQTVARRHITPGPNYHMPFNFTTTSRRALALKFGAYMGTGFMIPFIAIYWHWNRPGGINNPL